VAATATVSAVQETEIPEAAVEEMKESRVDEDNSGLSVLNKRLLFKAPPTKITSHEPKVSSPLKVGTAV